MNPEGWYQFKNRKFRHYIKDGCSICGMIKGYHEELGYTSANVADIPAREVCQVCFKVWSVRHLNEVDLIRPKRPQPLVVAGRTVVECCQDGQTRYLRWWLNAEDMSRLLRYDIRELVEWLATADRWLRRF